MPIRDRLDPELEPGWHHPIDLSDIAGARAALHATYAKINTAAPNPAVVHADHVAPGRDGGAQVMVRVFRPADADLRTALPCLYWTQGGGYVLTAPDMDDQFCEAIVAEHACVAVSVDWRRAPEHPFPAAIEDCYTGLHWVIGHAAELGIDPTRVVIGGHSSGGGKTAGLALLVRDRGELDVAHQLLIYPMLDDTLATPSAHDVTDPEVWNRHSSEVAWRCYLGDAHGTGDVSPYAAPARATDLAGLPPATMLVGELDAFRDEAVLYALRLSQAGVPTELHVYAGGHHGFDRKVPGATLSARLRADRDAALRKAFGG